MTLRAVRAVLLLLACGFALWFVIGDGRGMGPVRWAALVAAVIVGAIPVVRRYVVDALDRIRHPSQRTIEYTSLLVGVLASAYFTFTAFHQNRDLFPKTHDEGSYLLGMQMLARGKLWMPRHELADFFDTFYVIGEPVYASLYFPGTALMYAPTVWTGWPTWVLPVVASGAIVGLLYRIVTDLVDGAAGLLAAILMTSLSWFRMLTIMIFSQVPMLLLGLLMVWAWLRWRKHESPGWLVAIGAFAGWAAITRPVDALCYGAAIGMAFAYELRAAPIGGWIKTAAILVAGATPFLGLQVAFNLGVTGSAWRTPYSFYLERDQPGTSYGFHPFDASVAPRSSLQQKRDYYRTFMQPMIERHRPQDLPRNWIGRDDPFTQKAYERARLAMLIDTTMPWRVLLPVAVAGLLGLRDLRRFVLWLPLPLLIALYLPNTFFLEHYAVVVAPAVILSLLLGGEALAAAWPRWADTIRASFTLGVLTLALFSTYELNPLATALDRDDETRGRHSIDDETFRSATLQFVNTQLPYVVQKPAVILFRYTPRDNVIEEPVYNNTAAWPDEQEIVFAHDLGDARNVEIIRYYARHQPDRMFYRFDRATRTLSEPLGTARSLSDQASGAR